MHLRFHMKKRNPEVSCPGCVRCMSNINLILDFSECLPRELHGANTFFFCRYLLFQRLYIKFHRLDHILRSEDTVKILLGEDAMFKHKIIHAAARLKGFLGNLC